MSWPVSFADCLGRENGGVARGQRGVGLGAGCKVCRVALLGRWLPCGGVGLAASRMLGTPRVGRALFP